MNIKNIEWVYIGKDKNIILTLKQLGIVKTVETLESEIYDVKNEISYTMVMFGKTIYKITLTNNDIIYVKEINRESWTEYFIDKESYEKLFKKV